MNRRMLIHKSGIGIALLVITVASLASCGGGKANEGDFKTLLGRIVEDASEQYGALAQRARTFKPNEPLPDDFKSQMRAFAATARRAADGIEALSPPQAAAALVKTLVGALRTRADGFERAAARATITLQEIETDASITKSGEDLDSAFGQLREAGFLPEEQPHE